MNDEKMQSDKRKRRGIGRRGDQGQRAHKRVKHSVWCQMRVEEIVQTL